ncbi:MAG: rhomboid family intramembrane serine protease [Nanoarchaeota archaeon]
MTDKWFNEKFEKRNLLSYSRKRLDENNFTNKLFRRFSITNWLIILNLLVYILIVALKITGISEEKLLIIFGLQAQSFFNGAYWTLLTSMFTHIWLPHLFFNMISLFFIGNVSEKIIGRKKILWFYIISGLFAGLFYSILSFYFGNTELGAKLFVNSETYSVGASGAIFGIAGLLAILTPKMKVYLIAGPIIALIIQSFIHGIIKESSLLSLLDFLIMVYIFFSIFSMFSFNSRIRNLSIPLAMPFWILPIVAIVPLVVIGLFVNLPIGNTAHFGGLIAGIVYGKYLKNKYKNKTEIISKKFS